MRQIGLSVHFNALNPAYYEEMMRAGVTAAELSVSPEYYPTLSYKRVFREMTAAGLTPWSFHLPFAPFSVLDPASLDTEIRTETVRYQGELIRRAADAGFTRFVLHASGEPNPDETRGEALKNACDSVAHLGDVAGSCGALLAVEDLPRTCIGNCSAEILKLIGTHPAVGVCFDTNHLTKEADIDFLHTVAPRLLTVHISDYDFIDERHWLPGEGKIDWVELMNGFDGAGYNGVFLYEVSMGFPSRTIGRERTLIPADFAQNARELHERKPLTKRGIPFEGLGLNSELKKK